uniref:Small ribosomal subunit protein mS26 n=1 Tax=Geotrypetes seraphini TaxID=260995 RepID=A0A6P8P6N4_GEOSA|nr:28S ribosomal protein S26, mitochondrial isoform X2 [Geotrypetes seraphini]
MCRRPWIPKSCGWCVSAIDNTRRCAEFQENVLQKVCEERSGTLAAERAKQEMDEHRLLMAWNDAENARKRIIREERMQQEQKKEEEQRLHAAIYLETLQKQILQEKTREVLQLQEEAKHFITKENLDQRIEAALDNPKNYNFSVDKEGRVAKRTALS